MSVWVCVCMYVYIYIWAWEFKLAGLGSLQGYKSRFKIGA